MNYPEHRQQEAEHRELTGTLDKLIWRAERSVPDGDAEAIVEEIAGLLRRWVANHIIGHDLKMKPYAAALRSYERDLNTAQVRPPFQGIDQARLTPPRHARILAAHDANADA